MLKPLKHNPVLFRQSSQKVHASSRRWQGNRPFLKGGNFARLAAIGGLRSQQLPKSGLGGTLLRRSFHVTDAAPYIIEHLALSRGRGDFPAGPRTPRSQLRARTVDENSRLSARRRHAFCRTLRDLDVGSVRGARQGGTGRGKRSRCRAFPSVSGATCELGGGRPGGSLLNEGREDVLSPARSGCRPCSCWVPSWGARARVPRAPSCAP